MKLLELIGLPIYDITTGQRVSKVKDIWISAQWMLTHLELEEGGMFHRQAAVIQWEQLAACGEDAVFIPSASVIERGEEIVEQQEWSFLYGSKRLKDIPLLTLEGTQLGWVADVYFQPDMGNTIVGLEITDGLISDLLEGRQRIDGTSRMQIGEHAILLHDLKPEHQ
ncbi:PRC-barrel domain-containing protein [Paenibacillus assamensis]|uniref:PRC-barrel domain-containing protein n=1 Tax=Paenibacillus assamensis TaxID=311244 RepID=UPI00041C174C|nr:PRC-barrel domain-containing protein [Paenibacillus assamensis]